MTDQDLIRRGDAIAALKAEGLPFGYRHAVEAINAIPAAQPTVNPLVWVKTLDGGEICLTDERYGISYWEREKLFVDRYTTMRRHPTIEAAKAAAQADYEARIIAALDQDALAALVREAERRGRKAALELAAQYLREKGCKSFPNDILALIDKEPQT